MRVARPVRELGQRAPWLHEGGVRSIAFARDGNVLTAGDKSFRLWMLATGEMARQSERGPREGYLHTSWFRPEIGRWFAVFGVGDVEVLRTWDLATGGFLSEVTLAVRGSHLSIDPDGRRLLTLVDERTPEQIAAAPMPFMIGDDRPRMTAHVVSVDDGSVLFKLDKGVEQACFLSDGSIALLDPLVESIHKVDASGGNGREIVPQRTPPPDGGMPYRANALHGIPRNGGFVVEYSDKSTVHDGDGKLRFEMLEHWSPLCFSSDGEGIAASAGGRVTVFDRSGKKLQSLSTESTPLEMIALSADKRVIAGARSTGEIHARLPGAPPPTPSSAAVTLPGEVNTLAVSPDGPSLTIACMSGDILRWKLGERAPQPMVGMGRNVPSYILHRPDGTVIFATHSLIRRFRPGDPRGLVYEARITESIIAISSDERFAALGDVGRFHLIDLDTGEHVTTVRLTGAAEATNRYEGTRPLALSNDRRFAQLEPARIMVWDTEGQVIRAHTYEAPAAPLYHMGSIAFVTGDLLAFADHTQWGTLDIGSGELRVIAKGAPFRVIAVDAARMRAAVRGPLSGGDDGVVVWDVLSGTALYECPDTAGWGLAQFLPDGSVVTTSTDRRILVWETP